MGKYDTVRRHLKYPRLTMFQIVERSALNNPDTTAYDFFGREVSYETFLDKINQAAAAFIASGITRDDRVTICLPNCPQALISFYALNRIGAVANMVHPQSAQSEIEFYLSVSNSRMIITLDMFAEKVEKAVDNVDHPVRMIIARMQDELPRHLSIAFFVKEGRKHRKFPRREDQILWKDFVKRGKNIDSKVHEFDSDHTSVILYSGGTSGTPKGICLTDLNFNACALQARESMQDDFGPGLRMLSCMPMFHGFGLGINIHTVLIHGVTSILMPNFTTKTYAEFMIKKRPNYLAGVPTIFDALLHVPELDYADLSFLKGMFCGGDSLSIELKKKIDRFLREHGANIQVREGYGLTECVTASCLTPKDTYKLGSIGLPFPDTVYAVVTPGTDEVVAPGKEGEIILKGPSVMKGYLDNEKETKDALRTLADGDTWLYTGDLGMMDEEGYVYFRQRIKRMIVTNGYNVYPGQIENVIDSIPEVAYSCVIGVKDPRRMQRVRAYVVLNENVEADDKVKEKIMKTLKLKVAGYALPREIIFRDELEKTLVGKVAFRKLEEEAEREG